MIKKSHFDIFFVRHLFFFIYQSFLIFKNPKAYYFGSKSKILSALYLYIVDPYVKFLKFKFIKDKKLTFKLKTSENLNAYGYSSMPKVNIETIDFIEYENNEKEIFTFNKINFNLATKFAEKNGYHALAKDYLKTNTVNFTIDSWNTKPFEVEFGNTMWHQDRAGYEILKIFIYLSDTDSESGPHRFVVGSHKPSTLRFLPLVRYKDEDVKKYYNEVIEFKGDKGTCFAENTRGLHRGTPPKKRARSILEFIYYTAPILCDKESIKLNLDNL